MFKNILMDYKTKNQIIQVASICRRWTEQYARTHAWFSPTTLSGLCGVASVKLYHELEKCDINSVIHYAISGEHNHAFVTVADILVDITATQFFDYKYTDVIVDFHKLHYSKFHKPRLSFWEASDFIDFQQQGHWHDIQIYLDEYVKDIHLPEILNLDKLQIRTFASDDQPLNSLLALNNISKRT